MAEFGADVTEVSATPSFSTPKTDVKAVEPVKEPLLLQGAADIFKDVSTFREGQKKSKAEAFLGQFSARQLTEIDAVEQGKHSSAHARTRIRANLIQALTDYPALAKDLISINGSILGDAGMGEIVTEGTKEEIRQEKLRDELVATGQVSPNASENEFKTAEENLRLAAEADRRFKAEMDTINLEQNRTNLAKGQMELLNQRRTKAAEDFLTASAPAKLDQLNTFVDKLLSDKSLTPGQAAQSIELEWAKFEQEVAPYVANLSSHQAESLMKAMQSRKDIALKQVTGEYTADQAKKEIERKKNDLVLLALNDPRLAKAYALSSILPENLPYDGMQTAAIAASEFINGNLAQTDVPANIFTDDAQGRAGLSLYLDMITNQVDENNPAQVAEQANHLQNIFNGVETYEGVIRNNPKAAIELVDWMSTSSFLSLKNTHPEAFINMDVAKQILQTNYADEVWGMVQKEFKENEVVQFNPEQTYGDQGAGKKVPTPDVVSYRATNNGMEFYATNPQNMQARKKAQQLNKRLAPVINKTVKAFAHLEGHTNYKQQFESVDQLIFQEGDAGGDAGDDLGFNDFSSTVNPDIAMAFIRDFEGFRSSPYYDVNAYRVGYGSDTMTKPDGSVVKVTPDTRVTRDDAERDLVRRTQEFAAVAQNQAGEAWDNLSDVIKAALTSVAYNYGSLPSRILDEVKSGDPEAIAQAVESLAGDNDGINRKRRRREADLIRGEA